MRFHVLILNLFILNRVQQQRSLWPIRSSTSSIGIATRGGARGGSVDRGRGRGRGSYHSTIGGGFQRSTSMYDEDARGGGRVSTDFHRLTCLEPGSICNVNCPLSVGHRCQGRKI